VLRARLDDAVFFFDEDKKIPLGDRVDDLKNVVFHSLLGTSYEKVTRFRQLAVYIAERINPDIKGTVERTAYLSKADLDTRMVGEFPNLQGIMGREYALIAGENPIVAKAIYEHYLPTSAGGKLPETDEGAIVSIADKMDTIVGCFGVNLIPTGDADPYALRRQALGIINIILDKNYHLRLEDLTDKSISILNNKLMRTPEDTRKDLLGFFKGRLKNQLVAQGHSYDVVDSVLATGASDLARSLKKIAAMEKFKKHPDFEPLTVAFKRVGNILKGFKNGAVDASLFESDEERKLHNAYLEIKGRVSTYSDRSDYNKVLLELASLREPVDDFFEKILVMAKDEKIRFNRLSLLEKISRLFYEMADFSKIVTVNTS
jgi:glycyl-tRNA synthetase beta chain